MEWVSMRVAAIGAMALILMPCCAPSWARTLVSPISPALAAP